MRCVLVNSFDVQGGAARAAYRLHQGLRRVGQDSVLLARNKVSSDPSVQLVQFAGSPEHAQDLRQLAQCQRNLIDKNRTELSNTYFSLSAPGYDLSTHPVVQAADVLNLHWVAGLLSPESVQRLHRLGKPLVWTLHDQRPFTGGCHFSAGCRGYEEGCRNCPQLRDNRCQLPERALAETCRTLGESSITIVTPSQWLGNCARRSALWRNARIECIPYGLDTQVFRPMEKKRAREQLGLKPQGFYFLFGADSNHEKRKGTKELLAAIVGCLQKPDFKRSVEKGQIAFLTFGHEPPESRPGLPITSLGHINSDQRLCALYSAADVFLFASREDNLPNTILEAMSCGTPVIANACGGVPELLQQEQSGLLVPWDDRAQYTQAILSVASRPERLQEWREKGLQRIHSAHTEERQATSYLKLFEELLAGQRATARRTAPVSRETVLPLKVNLGRDLAEIMNPTIQQIEIKWGFNDGLNYKPSWRRDATYLGVEHEQIWEKTKDLPGWQDPPDSQKLYEMGYYNGAIILEIGVFGGRSAVVELLGANQAVRGTPAQYYGLDVDPAFLERSLPVLRNAGVADQCLVYHGNLRQFHRNLPIVPTMVFVDGDHNYEGVLADLELLRTFVAPETPILCHDYAGTPGVKKAVDEILQGPYYEMAGQFSGSVLLRATAKCPGQVWGLSPAVFQELRQNLLSRYLRDNGAVRCTGMHTPTPSLFQSVHNPLGKDKCLRTASGHGPWPYSAAYSPELPKAMPDGRPWPKISIVTPSYNQGRYIEQTILSVLNQKYPNLEYIIMDGGSTDETLEILERYRPQLACCLSEEDRGQTHAINKGFSRATGEIFAWLNSDDMLAPGALAAIAMAFQTSEADMVAGVCQLHQDGKFINQHLTSCADGPLPLEDLLDLQNCWLKGQFFHQPEVFFKRSIWEKAGGALDESLHYSLDYELWVRLAKAGARLKVIGKPIAQFRVHPEQKTFSVNDFLPELEKVRKDFLEKHKQPLAPRPAMGTEKQQLRIVLFNDVGFHYGAGIAQQRLAIALATAGHQVIPIAFAPGPMPEYQQTRKSERYTLEAIEKAAPDVVIIGNLHAAGYKTNIITEIAARFPTVCLLHDLWLLTGRCAYSGGCNKFPTGCDQTCPTPQEYPSLPPEQIAPAWDAKTQLLASSGQLTLAGNSLWMTKNIEERLAKLPKDKPGQGRPVGLLRFGLPLDIFKPRDKTFCREMLGLPQDKFILLFSCSNTTDRRKGIDHLIEAMELLSLPDLMVVCLGQTDRSVAAEIENLVEVGYVRDPQQLALFYAAADLFVSPALEEAFGQVFVEAAACGTPSVAYPVGGVPEALAHNISGQLAEAVGAEALAAKIRELYLNPERRKVLSLCGRVYVESEFSFALSSHKLAQVMRTALAAKQIRLVPKIYLPMGDKKDLPVIPPVTYIFERLDPKKSREAEAGASDKDALWPGKAHAGLQGIRWISASGADIEAAEFLKRLRQFYQEKLNDYRRAKVPWVLKPGAWLARYNRNAVAKSARKTKQT